MAARKKSLLFTSIIILAAAACVRGTPEVMKMSSTYSCCGSPALPFDQRCDNTWSINDANFAYSNKLIGTNNECTPPCKEIKDGEMLLETCVDVNLTTVCTKIKVINETRIHYHGEPCSKSLSNAAGDQAGHAGFLLLDLVIAGWFVK